MSENKNSVNKLLLVLVVVQFAAIAYLLFNNNEKTNTIESQATTIEEKEKVISNQTNQLDSLENEVNNKIAELSKLGQDYESLVELKNQISNERDQLKKSGNVSAAKIKELNEKIKGFVAQLEEKDMLIADLKSQNEAQAQEITGLETKTKQLGDSIGSLAAKNTELVDKVTLASILRIEGLKITSINKRSKEKESDENEFKSSRIEKLKITFNLGDNKVTPKGNKTIYMKIVEPNGTIITEPSSGTFMHDNKETYYTAKQTVAFDNSRQSVVFYFTKAKEFAQGKHSVELFEGGYKIGEGSFVMK